MKKNFTANIIAVFCAAFAIVLFVDCFIPRAEAKIFDSVIRLHVLANSDGERDQEVKLKVRDAVIKECGGIFAGLPDDVLPLREMDAISDKITETANRVLAENGFAYGASAVWGREAYPEREYDGISFPAGQYYSLRILLGDGKGENWWCVLFPPLCTGAAKAGEGLDAMGIDRNSSKVFSGKKYVFRFKILEFFR